MKKFLGILLTVLGVVMGGSAIIMGIATYHMSSLSATNTELASSVGAIEVRLGSIENSLKSMESTNKVTQDTVADIAIRVRAAETDPTELLAGFGLQVTEQYTAANIGGRIYVFPKTPKGEKELKAAGFVKDQLSPVLVGYRVNTD